MSFNRFTALAVSVLLFAAQGCMRIEDGIGAVIVATSVQSFGTVAVGGSKSVTYLLKNEGDFKATSFSVSGTISAPFSLVSTTCLSLLDIGQGCEVVVAFSPTAAGEVTQSVGIDFNDGADNRHYDLSLTGTGVVGAHLAIEGILPYSFGVVYFGGAPGTHTFNVVNDGTSTASGISVSVSGTGFSLGSNNCGATLAVGVGCSFDVLFTAPGVGPYSGKATVQSSGLSDVEANVTATGAPML